jgi:hypothetical protein
VDNASYFLGEMHKLFWRNLSTRRARLKKGTALRSRDRHLGEMPIGNFLAIGKRFMPKWEPYSRISLLHFFALENSPWMSRTKKKNTAKASRAHAHIVRRSRSVLTNWISEMRACLVRIETFRILSLLTHFPVKHLEIREERSWGIELTTKAGILDEQANA